MYMILNYGAVGVNSCSESRQLVTHSNKDLFWIYGHLYQIKESNFSQKLYDASLSNRLKDGPQWVSCVVFITTLLWHCTLQEHVFNGHSVARMLASCQWSSVLGTRYGTSWPRCGQFKVGWLQLPQLLSGGISWMVLVFVSRDTDIYHIIDTPIWFEPPVPSKSLQVAKNLHSEQLPTGLGHGQGSFLLAGPLFYYPPCHNVLAPSRSVHKCLCHSMYWVLPWTTHMPISKWTGGDRVEVG